MQSLQEALEAKALSEQTLRQQQEATEKQLEASCSNLQRSEEAAESLRQELGQLRAEYERGILGTCCIFSGEGMINFRGEA